MAVLVNGLPETLHVRGLYCRPARPRPRARTPLAPFTVWAYRPRLAACILRLLKRAWLSCKARRNRQSQLPVALACVVAAGARKDSCACSRMSLRLASGPRN